MGKIKIGAITVLNFCVRNNIVLKYLKQNDIECRGILGRKLRKQGGRGEFIFLSQFLTDKKIEEKTAALK